jgi:6-phosphogluconolactonase
MLKWRRFEGRAELDTQLSQVIIAALSDAIERRDTAYLVVSGGSTPVGLFGELARNSELDWRKVVITLADERWVPRSHPDSNQQLVEQQLLRAHAAAARFIPLYTGADTPEQGSLSLEHDFATLPKFDVVLLGMGGDAHTASLFPNTEALTVGLDPLTDCAVLPARPQTAPHARMTLTLKRLVKTRQLFLHITGKQKELIFNESLGPSITAREYPIRAFALQDQCPLEIFYAP